MARAVRRTADFSVLYPPVPERFNPTCFESDGTVFLGGIFLLSSVALPEARSDVRPFFDLFYFLSKFLYFELNLSRIGLLAFFECLLLFHAPFNEQILDIRYPNAFFRG